MHQQARVKERKEQEKKRVEMEAYKATLGPDVRARLQKQAEESLAATKLPRNMITGLLVELKENELIREGLFT